MKKDKDNRTLADKVREVIGADVLKALGAQPLALAGGGVELLLQAACTKCAGYQQPAESVVRELRVSCGSKAEAKPASRQ